jgi:putative MATE family efflux protein
MQKRSVLDTDHIGALLLKLSIPAFFGMAVITLYNVIDTVFVSRYVGPLALAGLSIVFPFQMLSMGIGQMTGMGGASHISRLIGAHDLGRAERVLGNTLVITLILTVLIAVIGLLKADFWLKLMGASDEVLPYARDYMLIILYGMIFQTFSMTISTLLNAEGNVRIAMTGMIIGATVNAILCAIFIIPLGMGVKGSAWATFIAQSISVFYYMRYYVYGKTFLKIHTSDFSLDWNIIRSILSIGVASLARTLAGSLSTIFVNRALLSYGGDLLISAYGILNRINMFATMPAMVIGQGLQPILGFNYGARRFGRALKSIKIALISSTAFSIAAFGILYFSPQPLIAIFSSDPNFISISADAARILFLAVYLSGIMMVGSTIFQALGQALPSFLTSIARPALFLIPLIFILPRFWQLNGIWLAFPVTDALTVILTVSLLISPMQALRHNQQSAPAEKGVESEAF